MYIYIYVVCAHKSTPETNIFFFTLNGESVWEWMMVLFPRLRPGLPPPGGRGRTFERGAPRCLRHQHALKREVEPQTNHGVPHDKLSPCYTVRTELKDLSRQPRQPAQVRRLGWEAKS